MEVAIYCLVCYSVGHLLGYQIGRGRSSRELTADLIRLNESLRKLRDSLPPAGKR
jgi:hypothetical protein